MSAIWLVCGLAAVVAAILLARSAIRYRRLVTSRHGAMSDRPRIRVTRRNPDDWGFGEWR